MASLALRFTIALALLHGCGAKLSNPEDVPPTALGPDASPGAPNTTPGPACNVAPTTEPLTIATDLGLVHGKVSGATDAYLGIPYSTPPVGPLRFTAPDQGFCWSGVRDATAYGAGCAQPYLIGGTTMGSEDCLTLNVWTPSSRPANANLPVLVYLFGGGDVFGTSDQTLLGSLGPLFDLANTGNVYDGKKFADQANAVIVTINYRIGALGFLATPELSAGSSTGVSGNYGLLDAISGLQWVQRNAAAFGGDPTHVMLFGESAGAINTCQLIASPLAKGLFASALMESGWCKEPPIADRYTQAQSFVEAVGCNGAPDVAACLRSVSTDVIVSKSGSILNDVVTMFHSSIDPATVGYLPWGPAVDGYVLPDSALAMLAAGTHNHVPVVMGNNASEGTLFTLLAPVIGCAGYRSSLESNLGSSLANDVLALYPCNPLELGSAQAQYTAVVGDMLFRCATRRALRAISASQSEPVRHYRFPHQYGLPIGILGPTHAMEVPAVWDTYGAMFYAPDAGDLALTDVFEQSWQSFAATGDPNYTNEHATWPIYDPTTDDALSLDTFEYVKLSLSPPFVRTGTQWPLVETPSASDEARCDFWDAHG